MHQASLSSPLAISLFSGISRFIPHQVNRNLQAIDESPEATTEIRPHHPPPPPPSRGHGRGVIGSQVTASNRRRSAPPHRHARWTLEQGLLRSRGIAPPDWNLHLPE